jgi:L-alanine-DL-glutamate epimerase-like enolase superfamily enzyme
VTTGLILTAAVERFPTAGAFTIARGSRTEAVVVVASVSRGGRVGQGECVPYARYGEMVDTVMDQVRSLAGPLAGGADRGDLSGLVPAGAARNAVDCALWDLEAQEAGRPVHALAGLPAPAPRVTAYTISLDAAPAMAKAAARVAARPLLKVKLGGDGDAERIAAVRHAAPHARLIVDANEAWSEAAYPALVQACVDAGVELIEQPFPAAADECLGHLPRPVPICADESVHDTGSLDRLRGRYDAVNIKLDKTGGLTEALRLHAAARARGLRIMVGCMLGTSLAMAPALLLAADADWVDLDGPLLLAQDRAGGLMYDGHTVAPGSSPSWSA